MNDPLQGDVWQFLDAHASWIVNEYFLSGPLPAEWVEGLGGGGGASAISSMVGDLESAVAGLKPKAGAAVGPG